MKRLLQKNILKMFKLLCIIFFVVTLGLRLQAQEDGKILKAKPEVTCIEVSTSDVDIFILPSKETVITYKTELLENTELSITRNGKYMSFTELKPAKGKLYIYVPENFLIETCRIQTVNSKLKIENIKSVYFVLSAIKTDITVTKSRFKNALLALSNGNLKFESGVVAVADFSINRANAVISIAENENFCNLFITRDAEAGFKFNGKAYTKKILSVSPKKPKKFISVSSSASEISFKFIPSLKEPEEKFDKYGISEFGPKRPPETTDIKSKFLPKENKP